MPPRGRCHKRERRRAEHLLGLPHGHVPRLPHSVGWEFEQECVYQNRKRNADPDGVLCEAVGRVLDKLRTDGSCSSGERCAAEKNPRIVKARERRKPVFLRDKNKLFVKAREGRQPVLLRRKISGL